MPFSSLSLAFSFFLPLVSLSLSLRIHTLLIARDEHKCGKKVKFLSFVNSLCCYFAFIFLFYPFQKENIRKDESSNVHFE